MTIFGSALAAMLAVASPGDAPDASAATSAQAPDTHGYVTLAKHGYLRRDLGLDPLYENRRYPGYGNRHHRSRGFRSDGAATTPPSGAGVLIYEDPATGDLFLLPNGLYLHTGDPALLER